MEVVLFPNKDKEGNQPDMTGTVTDGNNKHNIAVWSNESDNGKYLSGYIEYKPYNLEETKENGKAEEQPEESGDSDLPF